MSPEEFRKAVEVAGYLPADPAAAQRMDSVCAVLREIEVLEDALSQGALLPGARGNLVANPALAAIARHRALLDRLLASLFPEKDERTIVEKRRSAGRASHPRRAS